MSEWAISEQFTEILAKGDPTVVEFVMNTMREQMVKETHLTWTFILRGESNG